MLKRKEKVDPHQKLMDQAYARWQDPANSQWTQAQFMSHLSPLERFAVATGNLNYQVCNGGFSQWHYNNYATKDTVAYLLKVTAEMGTPASIAVNGLLARFQTLEQQGALKDDEEGEADYDALDQLDTAFYKVNDLFLVDCGEHLKKLGAK